jgi:hypothetical protein
MAEMLVMPNVQIWQKPLRTGVSAEVKRKINAEIA